jgi:hypothetical protein
MRHAPDPGQGSLFASTAKPAPERRRAMDPNLPMANHAFDRHGARPTSAAPEVEALPRSGTQRARVLEAIRSAGRRGLTDEEIEDALHLGGNTERPRRKELEEAGLILGSGDRRDTSTGRAAIVWATPEQIGEVARGA